MEMISRDIPIRNLTVAAHPTQQLVDSLRRLHVRMGQIFVGTGTWPTLTMG